MRRHAAGVALVAGAAMAVLAAATALPAQAAGTAPMLLTLTTSSPGTSAALPLDGVVTGIRVDWGDGAVSGPFDSPVSAQHTYATAGAHQVTISGTKLGHYGSTGLPGLAYTSDLVTRVQSFGDIGITDLGSAFDGASTLISVPSTLPPGITNLEATFRRAARFNGVLAGWDTSQVTSMASMFQGAMSFDQPLGSWNTSRVVDMSAMFSDTAGPEPGQRWTTVFNQPIGAWDVSKVTDFSWMFAGNVAFDQPLATWTMRNSPDWAHMFDGARRFDQSMVGWDLSCPGDMSGMFDGAVSWSVAHFSDFVFPSVNSLALGCGFHGLGAHDSYATQEAADGMAAYEIAMPGVHFDYAGVAEPPLVQQLLVLRGSAVVGGTVTAATDGVFVGGLPSPRVAFRWQSPADGVSGWVDVPGGAGTILALPEALGGRYLRSLGTASNGAGPDVEAVSWNVLGPVAPVAPPPPTAVAALPGSRTATVSWTPPNATGGAPITGYRAVATSVSGLAASRCEVAPPATRCAIGGLANGARYTVSVTAVNGAGLSSGPSTPVPLVPRRAPNAVRTLTVTRAGPRQVVLRWRAPASTGGSPITGYQVRWRFRGPSPWAPWTFTRNVRLPMWPGWPWRYAGYAQVRALNAAGAGPTATVRLPR